MFEQLSLRAAGSIVTRHWWVIRRANPWSPLVGGLFEPFLYLMSVGVGIGTLIGKRGQTFADGYSYASFVAPALLATSAMNTAANQTIWGIWSRLKFGKFYDSLVATPLTTTDIAVGEAWAATLRVGVAGICFLGVITILGMVDSRWALADLAVMLIAFHLPVLVSPSPR
jgi:lipooligosaccharide transport system permease protein